MNNMNTLTNERLEEIVERRSPSLRWEEAPAMAQELLSLRAQLAELRGQEPVAWRYRTTNIKGNKNPDWSFSETESLLGLYEPLYASPVPQAVSQPAPVGIVAYYYPGSDTETEQLGFPYQLDDAQKSNSIPLVALCQPYTVPDDISIAEALKQLKKDPTSSPAVAYKHGWRDRSAAMLQSGNSPAKYPELLPCDVFLAPGIKIGKGCRTSALLLALNRRSVYEADLAAMSDEDKASMTMAIEDFKKLLSPDANYPVVPDGWALVPIEPTWEMLSEGGCKEHHKGQECLHHDNRRRIWRAMLSAAPQHNGE